MMITILLMYTLFDIPFEIGFLDIRYSVYFTQFTCFTSLLTQFTCFTSSFTIMLLYTLFEIFALRLAFWT